MAGNVSERVDEGESSVKYIPRRQLSASHLGSALSKMLRVGEAEATAARAKSTLTADFMLTDFDDLKVKNE